MKTKTLFLLLLIFSLIIVRPSVCSAAGFISGVGKTLFSSLEIPKAMLEQSGSFPFGLVTGALSGTFRAVTGTISGVGEMAQGAASGAMSAARTAAPYAKYAPLFLL